jgi:hypothetical protein
MEGASGASGGGAELTAGERRFVEAAMGARADEVKWVGWVLKLKRDKVQDRLLVLGRYRLLSIKRSKVSGKKAVRPLPLLPNLFTSAPTKLDFRFVLLHVTTKRSNEKGTSTTLSAFALAMCRAWAPLYASLPALSSQSIFEARLFGARDVLVLR